jgi:hypothetical protein
VRVLVDDELIALDIIQQLADAGFEVVGPAKSVRKALRFVAGPGQGVMWLPRVNLGGEGI